MEVLAKRLYEDRADFVMQEIDKLIKKYKNLAKTESKWVSENEVMLITYGDTLNDKQESPLKVLDTFLSKQLGDTITAVHILPCFPFTSDDGFSVVDYREIDPELGTWEDVKQMASHFDLMLDAVINHASVKSEWFQGFLNGDPTYQDFFITADPTLDYSKVTRPRALPLLTEFKTSTGKKHIWTTFSCDQVDLNYRSPELLIQILDILALYASSGARFIRLDAIGFMYKIHGTSCMHLEEAHLLIQFMREFLDCAVPGTILITETNVPHLDNISYFGKGNEAHMVYQFPLPPLTLYSFYTQNAKKLMDWASILEPTQEGTSFFNFLASHDGIGLRPTEGILTDAERSMMVDNVIKNGGLVSFRDNSDGTKSPYELNINYLDALTCEEDGDSVRSQRILAAHAILLAFVGVPGIYIHSLLGSRNDRKAADESGINRRINRQKLDVQELNSEFETNEVRKNVFSGMKQMIKTRRQQKAFSPEATQEIKFYDERIFSIKRVHEPSQQKILVLVNVSNDEVELNLDVCGVDLISGTRVENKCIVKPLAYLWIVL